MHSKPIPSFFYHFILQVVVVMKRHHSHSWKENVTLNYVPHATPTDEAGQDDDETENETPVDVDKAGYPLLYKRSVVVICDFDSDSDGE